jgi:Mor family transcriptional regulator
MTAIKFTNDMQMISEIIGNELTMKLIANLGGISIYVPRPDHGIIVYYYHLLGDDTKKTAQKLGVSERTVYRALQGANADKQQLTIFDEINRISSTTAEHAPLHELHNTSNNE